MGKRKSRKIEPVSTNRKKMSIITLGKPEPILTTQTQYQNIWYDNDYDHYILPIERIALAQLVNLNAQHGGVLYARQNMILADFIDGGLTHEDLKASIMNYLIFGDTAILKVRNYWGEVVELCVLPSLFMRRRKDDCFVILQEGEPLIYSPEDVIFIKQYDPQQQVYGTAQFGKWGNTVVDTRPTCFSAHGARALTGWRQPAYACASSASQHSAWPTAGARSMFPA